MHLIDQADEFFSLYGPISESRNAPNKDSSGGITRLTQGAGGRGSVTVATTDSASAGSRFSCDAGRDLLFYTVGSVLYQVHTWEEAYAFVDSRGASVTGNSVGNEGEVAFFTTC